MHARAVAAATVGGDRQRPGIREALLAEVLRAIVKKGPPSQCSCRARTVRREPSAETPSGAPCGPRTRRTTFCGLASVGRSSR